MDNRELRTRLGDILREEERSPVDWSAVNGLIDKLDEDLLGSDYPHLVGCYGC